MSCTRVPRPGKKRKKSDGKKRKKRFFPPDVRKEMKKKRFLSLNVNIIDFRRDVIAITKKTPHLESF